MTAYLVLAPALAFAIALLMLKRLLGGRLAMFALDQPNARSLHSAPVPRTGGLAVMGGTLGAWIWLADSLPLAAAAACAGLLLALSFFDDVKGLPVVTRFAAHVVLAALFAWLVLRHPTALAVALAIAWMTNLYNFMDGSDGLAGGMALFGFGAYGIAAFLAGDATFALMAASVVCAALAFLFYNFHPARIFMGDSGSIPLGFLAGALGLVGWHRGLWPGWFPLLVFSPFVVDATATLARRALRGEKVWQAHREHYYQRMVQMGLGHRNTALIEYAVMALAGGSAIWAAGRPAAVQAGLLMIWVLAYALAMALIDSRWRKFTAQGSSC